MQIIELLDHKPSQYNHVHRHLRLEPDTFEFTVDRINTVG